MSTGSPDFSQGGTPPPPQTPYQQTPPPGYGQPPAAGAGLTSNVAAGLAYITFIPAVIFLVLAPYNRDPLVRFHSFQSIFLAVASLVLNIALMFLGHLIPLVGLLSLVVGLAFFVLWLIAIIQAFQGKYWKVPFLGDLAMQQAGQTPVV